MYNKKWLIVVDLKKIPSHVIDISMCLTQTKNKVTKALYFFFIEKELFLYSD